MAHWALYRYRHTDGSSKDWAVITHSDGSVSTRWGKSASRLPGFSTRSVRQVDIARQKQRKGYVFIGEVSIDDEGSVSFPVQKPPPSTQPLARVKATSLITTLYWHVDCHANPVTCQQLGGELRHLLDVLALYADDDNGIQVSEPWDGGHPLLELTQTAEAFTQSGQIEPFHGVKPLLLLMALKRKDFVGVSIGIATDHSRELSTDLQAEPAVLMAFGTTLERLRPTAELLGLLPSRLNLAQALAAHDDHWF